MTMAISGASGQLGRLVIEKLKERNPASDIVALVRTAAKGASLGVSVREADYDKPDSLTSAFQGIDILLLISGNVPGQRLKQHSNVIEAAKKSGIKHIVYTSLLHADRSPLNLAPEHRATEALLKASGITYTILRNGWYTENYTGSVKSALALGALYGCAGNGKISSAPRVDYAEAAAVVLTSEGHEGKTYELAGDTAYTLTTLADEISAQSGKKIPYLDIPEADYARALKQAGLPEDLANAIASWDVGASQGALFDESHQLSSLLSRSTGKLTVSVKEALE